MLVTPGSPGVEVGVPMFLLKHLIMLLLQTDIGLACVNLGREVWTLRSDSRLPPGIITLVTISLAVKAMQTLLASRQLWRDRHQQEGRPPLLHSPLLAASPSHQQFLSTLFPVPLIFISDFSIVFAIFQQTDRPALPCVNRMQSSPTQILLVNLH